MDSSYNTPSGQSFPWTFFFIGLLVAGLVTYIVYLVMSRNATKPLVQGFYAGPTVGAAVFPCANMSAEAASVYSLFARRTADVGEEGPQDLHDLRNLLSKLCCMKQDLMGVAKQISAVKELQFSTHQDIQPVADMTASCFAKTVPERDLDIQFGKWRDSGKDLIRRLCTATKMTETERAEAEALFLSAWKDAYKVAQGQCLSGPVDGAFKTGPHEPAAHATEEIAHLREYDGYY